MIQNGLGVQERGALVQRVLNWPGLRRAGKLARLLQCLHESGDGGQLTEKELAARLFPRPARLDSQDDSIVRVSVRQLRFKLKEYFSGEGEREPWTIEIPRGEYRLIFTRRLDESVQTGSSAEGPARRLPLLLLGCTLAIGLALGLGLAQFMRSPPHSGSAAGRNLLQEAMDGGKYSLTIVPGDALRRQLALFARAEPDLTGYLDKDMEPGPGLASGGMPEQFYRWLAGMRLVTTPHAASAAYLASSVGEMRSRVAVRHPRDVSVRMLQQNSFAFLAARLMNPIVDVFEPWLTLRCENTDPPERLITIVDTLAQPGQTRRYLNTERADQHNYGRVALLPNLGTDGGRILLLSGLGAVGTEAAATVASDPRWLREIRATLPSGQIFFEALVEARAVNAMPVEVKLLIARPVAHRR